MGVLTNCHSNCGEEVDDQDLDKAAREFTEKF